MVMTNFAQRLKSVNFFQTTKFFQRRYQSSNTSLMFVQTFRSYFSEEIILLSLSEWLSAQVCIKRQKTDRFKSKSQQKTNKKMQTKTKYLHNIQG
jgi:hypothetical protein